MEGKNLSSQEIYEKLLLEDKFNNANPSEIVKTISDYQYKFQEDTEKSLGFDPDEFFKNLEEVSGFTDELVNHDQIFENLNKTEEEAEINVLESIDNISNMLFSKDRKLNFTELDNLLDDLLNKEEDINLINFSKDESNIFEVEYVNPTLIDIYKDDELSEEEIIEKLLGSKKTERKIGSSLQRTIKVFEVYQTNNLIFKDEALELSELIIRKLISFKTIILDFS